MASKNVAPSKVQRWDNPVPMFCDQVMRQNGSAYLGAHAHPCGTNAAWVHVDGETVVSFRCHGHRS